MTPEEWIAAHLIAVHEAAVAYYEVENPDIPFDTLPLERILARRSQMATAITSLLASGALVPAEAVAVETVAAERLIEKLREIIWHEGRFMRDQFNQSRLTESVEVSRLVELIDEYNDSFGG